MMQSAREIINNWNTWVKCGLNKFVSVDEEAAIRYARELKKTEKKIPHWFQKGIYAENDLSFARTVAVESAVNFCFPIFEEPGNKFSVENPFDPARPFRGAMAMSRCFRRAFGEEDITAEKLRPYFATFEKTAEFFRGINRIPLLEHRHWIMREVIGVLETRFAGDPLHIYEEAGWDALSLVNILVREFPQAFGDDVCRLYIPSEIFSEQLKKSKIGVYKPELEFRFYKKAKLVAVLYQGRALKSGSLLKPLTSMFEIVAVEDYQVPRFLQYKGILVYSPELLEMIRSYKIIRRRSRAEVEIRATTTVANAVILEELNSDFLDFLEKYASWERWDILPLDAAEWFGSRGIELPHHITPTTDY